MAPKRRAVRFWPFLERPYQHSTDRRNLDYFQESIILLIIIGLVTLTSCSFVKSQIPNDLAVQHLFQQFSDFKQGNYYSVLGKEYSFLKDYYHLDSAAKEALKIAEPDIRYKKIGKRTFLRTIEWELSYTDTTSEEIRSFQMEQTDTLSSAQVKISRDIEEKSLRGTSPFPVHKYLLPALGTAAGFAAIISLFYIRS